LGLSAAVIFLREFYGYLRLNLAPLTETPLIMGVISGLTLFLELLVARLVLRTLFSLADETPPLPLSPRFRTFSVFIPLLIMLLGLPLLRSDPAFNFILLRALIYFGLLLPLARLLLLLLRNGRRVLDPLLALTLFFTIYTTVSLLIPFLHLPLYQFWLLAIRAFGLMLPVLWIHSHHLPRSGSLPPRQALDLVLRPFAVSEREKEIVALLFQGKTYQEIEAQLFISFNTVKTHVYNVYRKLGINSRAELTHLILSRRRSGVGQNRGDG
jgi:DNA-binding CsgD family transcriptional regulator